MEQLPPTNRESERTLRTRSGARHKLTLSGTIRIEGARPVATKIRNLSEGGLMVEHAAPLDPGTAVEVDIRNLGAVTGTVAWSTDGRVGIAFDTPLDPERISRAAQRKSA